MSRPVLVCGAGAIGGTIAGFLADAGHPVIIVDTAADHVAAIRQDGLKISGPVKSFVARCEAFTPDELSGTYDLMLLAVKAQHTESAVNMLRPHLSKAGAVVSVQNGLNEKIIAEIVGVERTIGCFINFTADYIGPGHIEYGGRGAVVVGEVDGKTRTRTKYIHNLLLDFDADTKLSDNIFGYLWSKMAFFALLLSQTLSDTPTAEFLDAPKFRPLIHRMVGEVAKVAYAEGIRLMEFQGFDAGSFISGDKASMNQSIDDYAESRRGSSKLYSGFWRDLAVRKRQTEVGSQSAPIFQVAAKHDVKIPIFTRAVEMISEIEMGQTALSEKLADELLVRIASGE